MTEQERLGKLADWWRQNGAALQAGCEAGNPYAVACNNALYEAFDDDATPASLTAAENALVELEADWEGK